MFALRYITEPPAARIALSIRRLSISIPLQELHEMSHQRGQVPIPASYYRGGTSRAVIFQEKDLPADRARWPSIFRSVIGSPDPRNGRQLDGLGGGVSSLSKVCVVSASSDPDADVDYTFVAIGVRTSDVDFSSNCGNMSSAIGPYAVNVGLVNARPNQDEMTVRIKNTNTGKHIVSSFGTDEMGRAATYGDFTIDGVAGSAAKIRLSFLDPS